MRRHVFHNRSLGRLFGSLQAGLLTGAVVALAALLPMAATAQSTAQLGGTFGVANVTSGDNAYRSSVNASQGQVVKVQLYYYNQEAENSNKPAQAVRAKITMPTAAGSTQSVGASVKGTNTDNRPFQVTVKTSRDDAILQYVPGTANWRHNTGTAAAPKVVDSKLSDEIVTGAEGVALGEVKPGRDLGGTITVQARVVTPGVKVTVQTQKQGATNQWSTGNTAAPGDTMRVLIGYQNTGSSAQNNVVLRNALPANTTIVPATTRLTNTQNPSGVKLTTDAVTAGGINIGNYNPGVNAYVDFEVKLPAADKLACGDNTLRHTATAKPEGLSEYVASATTTVKRDCGTAPTPAPTPAQPAAAFSCDQLTVTKKDGRTVEATVAYTAKDGATFKTATYNFGDNKQPLTTDKTTVPYTYDRDGTFTVSVSLVMAVNGKDQTVVNNTNCAKQVSVAAAATPPESAPPASPSALPNTGTGEVLGLAAVVTVVATILHRLYLSRRLAA